MFGIFFTLFSSYELLYIKKKSGTSLPDSIISYSC